jgi:septal ring factor EnvC (AmiA/AmiB activator)
MGPIANSLSPATQTDALGILQRDRDRAIALLSSSPLLASLFVSCANQAAALESTSATPSPESEEWMALRNTITALQEDIKKLKLENLGLTKGLESTEALRSSLEAVNATQRDNIKSLQVELAGVTEKYNRFVMDLNAEKAALQIRVLGLEVRLDPCPIIKSRLNNRPRNMLNVG